MSDSDLSAHGTATHINFDAPATFRKWPSLNGQRRIESAAAYLLVDGPLDAASGISWLRRFRCDTSTKFIRHRSHHWWTP